MPRKPVEEQSSYQYANRSRSYHLNRLVKDFRSIAFPNRHCYRYLVTPRSQIVIRNPHRAPLLHGGKKP